MADDDLALRRKRLTFRSRYRGFLENDLIFARFVADVLPGLDPGQLDRYGVLLDQPDQEIWEWVVQRVAPPPEHDNDVLHLLRRVADPHLPPE